MKIKHLIVILILFCLISIFINRKTLFSIKEGVKCKEKCPAAEHGMTDPDANDCWSNGGQNKWCRPTNDDGNNISEYKKWACDNCSECKEYAGGPWRKYLEEPVECGGNKWSPWKTGKSRSIRKKKAKNWCDNYHISLEKRGIHTQNKSSGCKKYEVKEYQNKNKCIKKGWYPFKNYCQKKKYYTRALCTIKKD